MKLLLSNVNKFIHDDKKSILVYDIKQCKHFAMNIPSTNSVCARSIKVYYAPNKSTRVN